MNKSRSSVQKYVISSALVASLAMTPALSEQVSANAGSHPVAEETSTDVQLLEVGDRGEEVKSVQTALESLGYYTYNLDGIYGPITEQAVEDFQADEDLAVDGIVGPETMEALSSTEEVELEEETSAKEPVVNESAGDSDVVAIAEELIGTPYEWGGTTPDGFDSSGFIQYVFNEAGVELSRTERDMWVNDGETVDSPSVGDVVFFEGTYDVEGASHSGIYIGDDKMIHAGEEGVEVSDLSIDYWQDHYLGVKSFK